MEYSLQAAQAASLITTAEKKAWVEHNDDLRWGMYRLQWLWKSLVLFDFSFMNSFFRAGVWFAMQRGRNVLFNNPIPKLLLVGTPGVVFRQNSTALNMYVDLASTIPESFTGPISVGQAIHYLQEDQPMNLVNEILKWDSQIFG